MKTRRYKHGLSLVEMLIVISVIALLATMVVGIASRIDNQSKEKLLKSTFAGRCVGGI
jgi:prepilin-type N-terminal cleavage/methylation domain-containing protein